MNKNSEMPTKMLTQPTIEKDTRQPSMPQMILVDMLVAAREESVTPRFWAPSAMPKSRPRCSGGAMSAMIDCITGKTIPRAMPLSSRRIVIAHRWSKTARSMVKAPHMRQPVHIMALLGSP